LRRDRNHLTTLMLLLRGKPPATAVSLRLANHPPESEPARCDERGLIATVRPKSQCGAKERPPSGQAAFISGSGRRFASIALPFERAHVAALCQPISFPGRGKPRWSVVRGLPLPSAQPPPGCRRQSSGSLGASDIVWVGPPLFFNVPSWGFCVVHIASVTEIAGIVAAQVVTVGTYRTSETVSTRVARDDAVLKDR